MRCIYWRKLLAHSVEIEVLPRIATSVLDFLRQSDLASRSWHESIHTIDTDDRRTLQAKGPAG